MDGIRWVSELRRAPPPEAAWAEREAKAGGGRSGAHRRRGRKVGEVTIPPSNDPTDPRVHLTTANFNAGKHAAADAFAASHGMAPCHIGDKMAVTRWVAGTPTIAAKDDIAATHAIATSGGVGTTLRWGRRVLFDCPSHSRGLLGRHLHGAARSCVRMPSFRSPYFLNSIGTALTSEHSLSM